MTLALSAALALKPRAELAECRVPLKLDRLKRYDRVNAPLGPVLMAVVDMIEPRQARIAALWFARIVGLSFCRVREYNFSNVSSFGSLL